MSGEWTLHWREQNISYSWLRGVQALQWIRIGEIWWDMREKPMLWSECQLMGREGKVFRFQICGRWRPCHHSRNRSRKDQMFLQWRERSIRKMTNLSAAITLATVDIRCRGCRPVILLAIEKMLHRHLQLFLEYINRKGRQMLYFNTWRYSRPFNGSISV